MRLSGPSFNPPKWLENTLGGILVIGLLPVIVPTAALIATLWLKRQVIGPTKAWRRWFAWLPCRVYVEHEFWPDKEWRWLEVVERRSYGLMCDTQFRRAGSSYEPRDIWSLATPIEGADK